MFGGPRRLSFTTGQARKMGGWSEIKNVRGPPMDNVGAEHREFGKNVWEKKQGRSV